jgi:hypothetical protein
MGHPEFWGGSFFKKATVLLERRIFGEKVTG